MLVSTTSFAPIVAVATALSNEHNNLPTCFDPNSDIFDNDSIDNIDFKKEQLGITFAYLSDFGSQRSFFAYPSNFDLGFV
uniref:Uncharacterized protein n=1 Tax=Fagus sylvatica TaxID=28930 RepID=A0A2N9IY23_FAGSY